MRRRALPVCAACAALLIAGCGGSSAPRHGSGGTAAASGKHGAGRRQHGPAEVSAGAISRAAVHSAAQPGYAVTLAVSVTSSVVDGHVSAAGSGAFDADSGSAELDLTLPGLFAVISPVQTQVVFAGDEAYAKVPASVTAEAPGVKPWLGENLDSFGRSLGLPVSVLRGALTPRTLLQALAADSRGRARRLASTVIGGASVDGYREALTQLGAGSSASVWIDPGTDLIRRIGLAYASHGGGVRATAQLTFTGYGAQDVAPVPAPSAVGTLSQALKALGILVGRRSQEAH